MDRIPGLVVAIARWRELLLGFGVAIRKGPGFGVWKDCKSGRWPCIDVHVEPAAVCNLSQIRNKLTLVNSGSGRDQEDGSCS